MTVHVLISGFVQGVGYRQFVKSNARKLGLTGYVTNLPDKRVEALFEGGEESIQEMIKLCKKGPFLSEVDAIIVENVSDGHFNFFEIIK